MSKMVFYKIGKFEFLLNKVELISEIQKGGGGRPSAYAFSVNGVMVDRKEPVDMNIDSLTKEREDFSKAWKECVG